MAELLARYGRVPVARMVQAFYREVLESPRLSGYFRDVDMETLVLHQTVFMRAVLGDPAGYTRERIREAHRRLQVSDEDFEEMLRLLHGQLEAHSFTPEDGSTVIGIYRTYRSEVVAGTVSPAE